MKDKFILDACCGPRFMWFNKNHPNTIYVDIREEKKGYLKERPNCEVDPDIIADFRNLPFKDKQFKHIVWDPPHLLKLMETSIMRKKFGVLNKETWQADLKKGFNECWRVLDDYGTLVFKWNEGNIMTTKVLSLFPIEPLYGHPTAKSGKTKWMTFMKIPNDKNK